MPESNGRILIVSDGQPPEPLTQAADQLGLTSQLCRLDEAAQQADSAPRVDGVVLTLEDAGDLESSGTRKLIEQLQELSINTLVLARQAQDAVSRSATKDSRHLLLASSDESCEMLKGRLAMLADFAPSLQRMSTELNRLRTLSEPLNDHFVQVNEEMQLASRLQQDFLPRELPDIPGIRFATIFRPASWVSGDIYDVMRLDEHNLGFYVADAVGHGMPAALLTMFIKRALITKQINGEAYELLEPGESLKRLNDSLIEQNLTNYQFATCCYGILNTETLQLRMANAGHPPPMKINSSGNANELTSGGPLLGVFENRRYETETFQLTCGDKLLLYSDGVELAFVNKGPDEPLRFRHEFGNVADYDVETMCRRLVEIIDREEGSLHPRDDVTIVGIEIAEQQRPQVQTQSVS